MDTKSTMAIATVGLGALGLCLYGMQCLLWLAPPAWRRNRRGTGEKKKGKVKRQKGQQNQPAADRLLQRNDPTNPPRNSNNAQPCFMLDTEARYRRLSPCRAVTVPP